MNGTFMVSLDFELFWGMLEVVSQESYRDNVLGGKKAIGQLLQLFETYGIHATWATVGFLFADNYEELAPFFPENRPSYENPELNYYANFEKIGSSEETAPCFYAPGLLERIAKTPGQETTAASTGASMQYLLATVPVASSTLSPGPAPT